MSKYEVRTTKYFRQSMKKLDKSTQRAVVKFIQKHLVDVDYPSSPGKKLVSNLSGYTRFRIGSYRLITVVDDDRLIITNIYVAKREQVYDLDPDKLPGPNFDDK
ncbi:type II toxin-antitoxin system RelE family toxin [Loigolactobacillus coryniformis]|uniref:type II toxin-antitoxin system RelE family toxin n=1 Tax=Loigolactobacillus coryniformis TaxID=1610 RepID=UPI001C5D7691|nr:type II toxin-antitoxin system RelE/ParE family toxin [Loigolactobacillus coryniformis]MBW4801842.1 type II toxin-antitoxin system RelE/ParE family toxin [Loigolactobacillus coryniformis subsp. torquens]MBW4804543.1 type II toxin-antitoxin system RelE/ParE family toxin [Loigolactobacillus coryniformis subsp. torquens]